MINLVDELKH